MAKVVGKNDPERFPAAFFDMAGSNECLIILEKWRICKYVTIKLLRSQGISTFSSYPSSLPFSCFLLLSPFLVLFRFLSRFVVLLFLFVFKFNVFFEDGEGDTIDIEFIAMLGFDTREVPPENECDIPASAIVDRDVLSDVPKFCPIADPDDVRYLRLCVAE